MAIVEHFATRERMPWVLFRPAGGWVAKLTGGEARAQARRLAKSVVGHPIYRAPHAFNEVAPGSLELADNVAHFLGQRSDRVAHARFFLTAFDVDLRNGRSIETWLDVYGPLLLVPNADADSGASLSQTWPGATGGLNVVLDLAVALGEAAIARDAQWRWEADVSALGTFACLTNGTEPVDLVRAMAKSCQTPGQLVVLMERFGVTEVF
jgi:hypothetical protein